jgi:hypothetical protein
VLRILVAVVVITAPVACSHPDPVVRPTPAVPTETASPTEAAKPTKTVAPTKNPREGISVAGNHLIDRHGRTLRLRGFNVSGAEYSCIENDGFFDTPDGEPPTTAMVKAMHSWRGANAVRIPLNEQCWLGLKAAPAKYSGKAYRDAVRTFVRRLNEQGFVAILDLHRSAPGDAVSNEQEQMPDRDHSIGFWRSVASTFRTGDVVFDLFNEPFPYEETNSSRAWTCWRTGGCTLTSTNSGKPYVAAGMNELIAAVRSTGSRTVLLAGGIYWAEGMTGWLSHRPADPLGQLAASFHAYSFNEYCASPQCYDRDLGPIAKAVPLVAGEVGPQLALPANADADANCPAGAVRAGAFAASTFDWLDEHGASYTPWSWDPWGDCWSLVTGWGGEPTPLWGAEVRSRLATD